MLFLVFLLVLPFSSLSAFMKIILVPVILIVIFILDYVWLALSAVFSGLVRPESRSQDTIRSSRNEKYRQHRS